MHLSGNQGTAHKSSRKTLFTPQISPRFWLNDVGHGPEFGELAPWRVARVQPEPVLPGGGLEAPLHFHVCLPSSPVTSLFEFTLHNSGVSSS